MKYYLVALVLLCTACAKPTQWQAVPPAATLAVAHFVHPENDWELMAGVLPDEPSVIAPESMDAMDGQLLSALAKAPGRVVMSQAMVRQCEEIVTASKERRTFESVQYWKEVGTCMKADYLLVPFVTRWQEREGGEWGVTRPASLTMDLYLIATASGELRRYHFEEEQKGLAENLLQGRRFVKRKGRWVTPLEIAAEAIEEGTKALGL
ncbi:hypothetical protein [Desulfomicrobium salsuginis]